MGERSTPMRAKAEADVIPFRRFNGRLPTPQSMNRFAENARAIRPRDVLLLMPVILPVVAAILLGLLGWFVAWLAVVALLTGAIVGADLLRLAGRRIRASAAP